MFRVGENNGIFLPVLGKQNSCGPRDRTSCHVGVCSLFPFSLSYSFSFSLMVLFCLFTLSVCDASSSVVFYEEKLFDRAC